MITFTLSFFFRPRTRTATDDYAFDVALPDLDHDMGHDLAEFYLDDFSFKLVAS